MAANNSGAPARGFAVLLTGIPKAGQPVVTMLENFAMTRFLQESLTVPSRIYMPIREFFTIGVGIVRYSTEEKARHVISALDGKPFDGFSTIKAELTTESTIFNELVADGRVNPVVMNMYAVVE